MQVFVSGGAGFIGSHLTERLLVRGHAVLVYDNLSTGKWENLPVTVFGEGAQTRDFVYVSDLVDLLVMAVLDSRGAVCGASRQRRYDDR